LNKEKEILLQVRILLGPQIINQKLKVMSKEIEHENFIIQIKRIKAKIQTGEKLSIDEAHEICRFIENEVIYSDRLAKSISFLKEATFEIKNLRSRNEIMKARLDMFDQVNFLLNTRLEQRGEGMTPDLVSSIESFLPPIY
jgi:hypothetical protein